MNYEWYTIINSSKELNQGDLIYNCPVIIPPINLLEEDEVDVDINTINAIILSQSCDLENNKIDLVLVCPFFPLENFLEQFAQSQNQTLTKKFREKTIKDLKQGNFPSYHIINKMDTHLDDFQVDDFRNVYGVNIQFLGELCSTINERIRLLPPYREHLSQAFARYFMRVGLPQNLEIG